MGRRRLFRHFVARRAPTQEKQKDESNVEDYRHIFESGFSHGMKIASMQQRQLLHEQALAIGARSEQRMLSARNQGYDNGYRAGLAAAAQARPEPKNSTGTGTYTYSDVEAARARGYEAGKRVAPAASAPSEKSIRDKIFKQLEEQRVVAESNPNMAPGVNAFMRMARKKVV